MTDRQAKKTAQDELAVTLRNDDVAWVDVVRDKIYTLCACVHNLSNYFQTSPTHAAAKLVGLKSS